MKAQIGDYIRVLGGRLLRVEGVSRRKPAGASFADFINGKAGEDGEYYLEDGSAIGDESLSIEDVLLESEVV